MKFRNTFYLFSINLKVWYTSSFAFPRIISLVLLQFINILLSCGHFTSSSVISLMVEGVSFLRISERDILYKLMAWALRHQVIYEGNECNWSQPGAFGHATFKNDPVRKKTVYENLILCLCSQMDGSEYLQKKIQNWVKRGHAVVM